MEKGNDTRAGSDVAPEARSITTASNLFRRALCPGSAHAELYLPERESSGAAEFGTEMHFLEYEGINPDDIDDSFKAKAIQRNADITAQFVAQFVPVDENRELLKEHTFFVRDEDGTVMHTVINGEYHPLSGKADEVLYFPKRRTIIIFDSKFGRWPVTGADINMQLRIYALAAYDYFMKQADFIYVAIRQPYLPAPENFHSAKYTAGQMEDVRFEIRGIIRASEVPTAPRNATLEGCRFCGALGTVGCPESIAYVGAMAKRKIATLAPTKLEELAPKIQVAKQLVDAWTARMKQIATTYPALLQHFELVPTGINRSIKTENNKAVYTELIKLFGDSTEEIFLGSCDISLRRLSDLAEKYFERTGNTEPPDVLGFIAHLVENKVKEPRLARKKHV